MLRPCMAMLLLCAIALTACGDSGSTKGDSSPAATPTVAVVTLARIQLNYGAGNLIVEVAVTPAQSERGLGYRDVVFERGGMLFDLHSTLVPSFWMKGMRVPLDMLWIDENKKVVAITPNIQPEPGVPDEQLKRYASPSPVRYVLELNAGASATFGITAGTQLAFQIPATLLGTPDGGSPAPSTPNGLPPTPVIGVPQP